MAQKQLAIPPFEKSPDGTAEQNSTVPWNLHKGLHYVVCVDGSKGSRACFEDACCLYKPGDHITVVTVATQKDKAHLKYEEQPRNIKEYYESRCSGKFPKGATTCTIVVRQEGEDTPRALLHHLHTKIVAPDFLVVGFVGRKGSKEDASVFGSVTDMSLRDSHIPSIISKNMVTPEQNHFFACVDGSDRAHVGVELALRLARAGDQITVATCEDFSDKDKGKYATSAVEQRYASFCQAHPPAIFRTFPKAKGESVAEALIAAAEDCATHMICGVDGVGKHAEGTVHHLGSTSDRIVRGAICSVICIQNRSIVAAK